MNVEFITPAELQVFKSELLSDIKALLEENGKGKHTKWLRTRDLRKILGSANTIAKLRCQGLLHPKRVGGILYYSSEEVEKLLS